MPVPPSENPQPEEGGTASPTDAPAPTIDLSNSVAVSPPVAPVTTIDLSNTEQQVGSVTPRELAETRSIYADMWFRGGMLAVIAGLFVWLNLQVFDVVSHAWMQDIRMLEAKPPTLQAADRLVTPNVISALIAATVAQVGIAIATIVSYLFPKNRGDAR